MRNSMRSLARSATQLFLLTALSVPAIAEPENLPAELTPVLHYMLQKEHYPESYQGTTYEIRVRGYAAGDIGPEDGSTKVFVLTDPHYHQTAPIQVLLINKKDQSIRRLREALAPGPLISRDDQRMDTHTLGVGVDMTIQGNTDKLRQVAQSASASSHVVLYKNFIHMDLPDDAPGFVDKSDSDEFASVNECAGFQFSQPSSIALGYLGSTQGEPKLAALVGDDIYVIGINGISAEGLLDKTTIRLSRPAKAERVLRLSDGRLGVALTDNTTAALSP